MPNLTWITKKYFPHLSPLQINSGNCYNWAHVAYKNYNSAELFTIEDYGGHAFVKIRRNFFDSESPLGEWNWLNLKFFQRAISRATKVKGYIPGLTSLPVKQSFIDFLEYWQNNGCNSIISVGDNGRNWNNW